MTEEPTTTEATPAAADLAAEHGVDPTEVEGTGADGKVTKADVETHIAEKAAEAPTAESVHARLDRLVAKLGGILGVSVED